MNFEFLTGDARATDKSIFIKWVPDGAKIKPRMVFSSSTKGLIDGLKVSADSFVNLYSLSAYYVEIKSALRSPVLQFNNISKSAPVKCDLPSVLCDQRASGRSRRSARDHPQA